MSRKNSIFKLSIISILAAAVLSTGILAGCGSDESSAQKETSVVTETEVVTKEANGAEEQTAAAEPNENDINGTEPNENDVDNAGGSANNANSGSGANSNSGSGTKSSSSSNSSSSVVIPDINRDTPSTNNNSERTTTPKTAKETSNKGSGTKTDNTAKALTLGGKEYKVGDTVKCTYYLMVPKDMLNFQGRVEYDKTMLKGKSAQMLDLAKYSSILNATNQGSVIFNGSMLSGYDYKEPGYEFMSVEYEVLKTGTTTPTISFEVLSDTADGKYTDSNGGLTNGAKIWAVYE